MTEYIELPDAWRDRVANHMPSLAGENPPYGLNGMIAEIESWRPVPAEAGDSTAGETAPGAKVQFDAGGKTYVGEVMPPKHDEYGPSWTWVDTGCGPLGIFIVPNRDLRPASSVRDTAPRVMRAWQQGDPAPDDVNQVRDTGDRRWCLNRTDNIWHPRDIAGPTYTWDELVAVASPLTEVRPASSGGAK